jgi:hypothetical protein
MVRLLDDSLCSLPLFLPISVSGITCVIVPLCTENVLRFSAVLHDVAPNVRFERMSWG